MNAGGLFFAAISFIKLDVWRRVMLNWGISVRPERAMLREVVFWGSRKLAIMECLNVFRTPSPVGLLSLIASEKGLVRLEFEGRMMKLDAKIQLRESKQALAPYLRELDEYFAGERRQFSMPLDLRGTPFQLACWRALLDIPYGETRTYAEIARAIGHPQAFRAVGMSNNRNPIAIVVPCHRVIASGGSLCGYGGGLEIKRMLLDLEDAQTGACLPMGLGA